MDLMRLVPLSTKPNKDQIYLDPNLITQEFCEFSGIIDCKICTGISINPICCKNCDSIFCKTCISDWIKRSNGICPNRCEFQEFEIRRTTKNMMNKIKLNCTNKDLGCKEEIIYEFYSKHAELCDYTLYECIGCGMKDFKKIIVSHIKMCEKIYRKCEFCLEKFICTKINEHYNECQMYEIPCKLCELKVKRYSFEKHLNMECKESFVECVFCGVKDLKRKDEGNHTKQVCFENYKQGLMKIYFTKLNSEMEKLNSENNSLKNELNEKDKIIQNLNVQINNMSNSNKSPFEDINSKCQNFGQNVKKNINEKISNIFGGCSSNKQNNNMNNQFSTNIPKGNDKKTDGSNKNNKDDCKNQ